MGRRFEWDDERRAEELRVNDSSSAGSQVEAATTDRYAAVPALLVEPAGAWGEPKSRWMSWLPCRLPAVE